MNLSELTRLLSQVAGDFATTLGVDPDLLAREAARVVPEHFPGDPARELRRACETTARKIANGARLERPGAFAMTCFRKAVHAHEAGPTSAPSSSRAPSAHVDPFVLETLRDIAEADAEIRRMPQSRHDRVRAIEQWRNERFTSRETPAPLWALYGHQSPEAYAEGQRRAAERLRAERGLAAPQPEGVQPMATVIKHSQTLRTLDEANNPDDAEVA